MGSNRTIQTILQAIMVVLLAALVYRLPALGGGVGGGMHGAPDMPSEQELVRQFHSYFADDKEASAKAEGLGVSVEDMSVEGAVAYVKLRIQFRWEGHPLPTGYTEGPLKNAPGKGRGDRVQYTEVFKFRHWTKGWDIEGRREPAIIQ